MGGRDCGVFLSELDGGRWGSRGTVLGCWLSSVMGGGFKDLASGHQEVLGRSWLKKTLETRSMGTRRALAVPKDAHSVISDILMEG